MITNSHLLEEGWRLTTDSLGSEILIPPEVPIEIIPHPAAPLFRGNSEDTIILNQLIDELTGPNAQLTNEVVQLTKQAALVSLWFFLKVIAGFSGPYNDLTDHIHRDMCNFRQRSMRPGAKAAIFIPRSFYKSTVTTHGGSAWELLRDPNLRIGMIASKAEMAEQFMHSTQRIFDDNPLMSDLFPAHCPPRGVKGNILTKRWNAVELVMPNRSRNMPEASIKCMGAGGATAGNHFDLLNVDDLIGEKQLNADHISGDEMHKIGNWFSSNQDTLLVSPKTSRVFLAATRYAPDDVYEQIYLDTSQKVGYWDELPYEDNPDGQWSIYHRQAIENDLLIFPEKVDQKFLDRIRKQDPWKYYSQYINNPFAAQASEFASYTIKECEIDFTHGEYSIHYFRQGSNRIIPLSECTVTIGIDPAASEVKRSSRTSRSAIIVQAVDANENRYYIDGMVGYFAPTKFVDGIFRLWEKYKFYISSVNMEGHGGFKFAYNHVMEEVVKRKKSVPLRLIRPLPDKDAKLRIFIQPLLDFGRIYAASPVRGFIDEEVSTFPGGFKRDTMDAMEIADRTTVRPLTTDEQEAEQHAASYREGITSRAGY